MLGSLFKKVENKGGATLAHLSRHLSSAEQWQAGVQIASGFNEVYESVYHEQPAPGFSSYPSRDSDGVRIYATICGDRTQCRIRDTDVMVHIDHISVDQSKSPVAQLIWAKIRNAEIT